MANTTRLSLRYPTTADTADVPRDIGNLASDIDNAAIFSKGTFAARPTSTVGSPGIDGRYYLATDTGRLYLDTGTAWQEVASGNGSVTASMLASGVGGMSLLDEQVFTSSTTYSLSSSAKIVIVEMYGGGGGGGGGNRFTTGFFAGGGYGSCGGGGAGCFRYTLDAADLGTSVTVTVGAGGTGGTGGTDRADVAGGNGGSSRFGPVEALPGLGGANGSFDYEGFGSNGNVIVPPAYFSVSGSNLGWSYMGTGAKGGFSIARNALRSYKGGGGGGAGAGTGVSASAGASSVTSMNDAFTYTTGDSNPPRWQISTLGGGAAGSPGTAGTNGSASSGTGGAGGGGGNAGQAGGAGGTAGGGGGSGGASASVAGGNGGAGGRGEVRIWVYA